MPEGMPDKLSLHPSEYVRRQVWATFQNDPVVAATWELFGEDNYMWASDFPHSDSTFPESHAWIDKNFETAPEAIRRKIVYETRHDVPVPAWLCIPRDIDGPAPGVLCIHGHGPHGKDALVDAAAAGPGLPFAAALADQGCVTLAPDHAGFGERDSGGGCNLLHARLNLLGVDITGYRVHDLVRATDLLASLPEVDERRIADVGFSLGCWLAEVHTAFDARIGAAVLSGWFTTLAQTVWTGHCVCHRSLGLGAICEIPDIIGLAAPRPVAAEWGADDTSRPVRPAFDMARDIWRAAGAEQDAELFEFDGDHWFDGTESIPWLVGKLRAL